jgi:hypothetical protein
VAGRTTHEIPGTVPTSRAHPLGYPWDVPSVLGCTTHESLGKLPDSSGSPHTEIPRTFAVSRGALRADILATFAASRGAPHSESPELP